MAIVKCTTCGNDLERNNSQIKASKTGNFFCNRDCRVKWDSEKFKQNKVKFTCPICSKEEYVIKSVLKTRKYCSQDCLSKSKSIKGNTKVSCDYCGKIFEKINSKLSNKNFCKKKCSTKWFSENTNIQVSKECVICSNLFTIGNNRKDTAKTCSIECHYSYIKLLSTEGHMVEQLRKNGLKSSSMKNNSDTLPERMVKECLEKENIPFEFQKPMYEKFIVDFYLPELDIVLEVYGDYWHSNPLFYGNGDGKKQPNSHQIKQMKKDKSRKGYITKCGHKFISIWENDIYKDVEKIIKQIINQNP